MGHESSRQHPGRCPLGCFRPSLIICSCREGMESRRDFTAAQGQGPPKPGQTACTRGHAKFMHRAPPPRTLWALLEHQNVLPTPGLPVSYQRARSLQKRT